MGSSDCRGFTEKVTEKLLLEMKTGFGWRRMFWAGEAAPIRF